MHARAWASSCWTTTSPGTRVRARKAGAVVLAGEGRGLIDKRLSSASHHWNFGSRFARGVGHERPGLQLLGPSKTSVRAIGSWAIRGYRPDLAWLRTESSPRASDWRSRFSERLRAQRERRSSRVRSARGGRSPAETRAQRASRARTSGTRQRDCASCVVPSCDTRKVKVTAVSSARLALPGLRRW
jgi:hypothetical protein